MLCFVLIYRKEKENCVAGTESEEYQKQSAEYREMVNEIVRGVQETPKKQSVVQLVEHSDLRVEEDAHDPHVIARRKAKHFVVSVQQVKDGLENVLR